MLTVKLPTVRLLSAVVALISSDTFGTFVALSTAEDAFRPAEMPSVPLPEVFVSVALVLLEALVALSTAEDAFRSAEMPSVPLP